MARTRAAPLFTKADVERATKGVRAAGLMVDRVEILPGKISVHVLNAEVKQSEAPNPYDDWKANGSR